MGVGIGAFMVFATVLVLAPSAHRFSPPFQAAFDVGWLILVSPGFRAAMAVLVADEHGVRVRNPFRTYSIPWREIEVFELGRYRLLGCQGLIRRSVGSTVPVLAISGATGQPRRKMSIDAQADVAELNALLLQQRESAHPYAAEHG